MIFFIKMDKLTRLLRVLSAVLLLIQILITTSGTSAANQDGEEDEVGRQATIVLSVMRYEWWLIRWSDNFPLCQVFADHEGLPTGNEIYTDCGEDIYNIWAGTPPCEGLQADAFLT